MAWAFCINNNALTITQYMGDVPLMEAAFPLWTAMLEQIAVAFGVTSCV